MPDHWLYKGDEIGRMLSRNQFDILAVGQTVSDHQQS